LKRQEYVFARVVGWSDGSDRVGRDGRRRTQGRAGADAKSMDTTGLSALIREIGDIRGQVIE
jgi:hypothetical protein